jgi:regulator of ribonuclease activity A
MNNFSTCDLCDVHEADTSGAFRVLPDVFKSYGGHAAFSGQAVTLRCPEDNSRVREAVQEQGLGRAASRSHRHQGFSVVPLQIQDVWV